MIRRRIPRKNAASAVFIHGDACHIPLADESVDCVITSPPYYGLRDYGTGKWEGGDPDCVHLQNRKNGKDSSTLTGGQRGNSYDQEPYQKVCGKCGAIRIDDQIGLEESPNDYVDSLVGVFREVRRVLKKTGVMFLVLGDSYNGSGGAGGDYNAGGLREGQPKYPGRNISALKAKDLIGIPWSVAKALQAPYYVGRIKSEQDRAWLAAVVDSEGSICGFTHKRKDSGDIRNGIHVTITNSNTKLLDECFRIWPTTREEHTVHSASHFGSLPIWRWIVHGIEEKSCLLRELYPYLIGKKKQALLAWNFLEISRTARGRNKGKDGIQNREKYMWLVNALSQLNHLEDVEVPEWCKEPPSLYEPGWYLRSDIIWSKPNPMPASVKDRPTTSHEYVFMLTKCAHYYYDWFAVREPLAESSKSRLLQDVENQIGSTRANAGAKTNGNMKAVGDASGRNRRSVWTINTQAVKYAHFATFSEKLVEICALAGAPEKVCSVCGKPWERIIEKGLTAHDGDTQTLYPKGSTANRMSLLRQAARERGEEYSNQSHCVGWKPTCNCNADSVRSIIFDPFSGSGTSGKVAHNLGHKFVGMDLNFTYLHDICPKRMQEPKKKQV